MEGYGVREGARAVHTCKERPRNRQHRRRVQTLAMICAPDGSEEQQCSSITRHKQCHPPASSYHSRLLSVQMLACPLANACFSYNTAIFIIMRSAMPCRWSHSLTLHLTDHPHPCQWLQRPPMLPLPSAPLSQAVFTVRRYLSTSMQNC